MSRKTRIIISITGIILIVSILIGVTYGFYVTKIYGNENSKSISITSGESSVLFTDLSSEDENVIIAPDTSTTKLFKVQNTGNVKATYSIFLVNVQNNFVRTEDVRYILYRIGNTQEFPENYTGCVENPSNKNACSIVVSDTEYPTTDSLVIGNEVIETPNDYYTYALVTTYINQPDINQDADQGHTYGGKIKIYATDDKNTVNPYEGNTTLLAYNIIENAINNKNGTILVEPEELGVKDNTTKPAEAASLENEKILSKTLDDHGTSYYYRGNVIDNYVNFAGMCWRIVRIQGDGSVKLLLEDMYAECNSNSYTGNWSDGNVYVFGYDDSNNLNFINYSGGLVDSFKTFQTTLAKKINTTLTDSSTQTEINSTIASKLKIDEWCFDDKVTATESFGVDQNMNETDIKDDAVMGWYTREYYGAYTRIITNKTPSLNCTGTKLTKFRDNTDMYIGTLTADEMSFAGASDSENLNYYLMNEYVKDNGLHWWSLTPKMFNGFEGRPSVFLLSAVGLLGADSVGRDDYFRPVIILKSGTIIEDGSGIIGDPYIIG